MRRVAEELQLIACELLAADEISLDGTAVFEPVENASYNIGNIGNKTEYGSLVHKLGPTNGCVKVSLRFDSPIDIATACEQFGIVKRRCGAERYVIPWTEWGTWPAKGFYASVVSKNFSGSWRLYGGRMPDGETIAQAIVANDSDSGDKRTLQGNQQPAYGSDVHVADISRSFPTFDEGRIIEFYREARGLCKTRDGKGELHIPESDFKSGLVIRTPAVRGMVPLIAVYENTGHIGMYI